MCCLLSRLFFQLQKKSPAGEWPGTPDETQRKSWRNKRELKRCFFCFLFFAGKDSNIKRMGTPKHPTGELTSGFKLLLSALQLAPLAQRERMVPLNPSAHAEDYVVDAVGCGVSWMKQYVKCACFCQLVWSSAIDIEEERSEKKVHYFTIMLECVSLWEQRGRVVMCVWVYCFGFVWWVLNILPLFRSWLNNFT